MRCTRARLGELIRSLPDQLDTVVGERGYRLSGGERQRLTIARLLLAQPRVVILDEATAALDSTNEAAVQAALTEALAGRTAVVIAHRLSTIRAADQILVIESGRIVEQGTHTDLLAAGGRYEELYRTQFDQPGTGNAEVSRSEARRVGVAIGCSDRFGRRASGWWVRGRSWLGVRWCSSRRIHRGRAGSRSGIPRVGHSPSASVNRPSST